jgi:murein DD-endopeptidase MepM/ murein hydrolase activator NlpD
MLTLPQFYAANNRSSGFMDPNYGGPHWGQDMSSNSRIPEGTEIPSLSTGTVVRNEWQSAHGWFIAVTAAQPGWYWTYSHRVNNGGIPVGTHVTINQSSLGPLGNTGESTGPHVHIQYTKYPQPWIHTAGETIDPWPQIQSVLAAWAGGGTNPIDGEEDMPFKVRANTGQTWLVTGNVAVPLNGSQDAVVNSTFPGIDILQFAAADAFKFVAPLTAGSGGGGTGPTAAVIADAVADEFAGRLKA